MASGAHNCKKHCIFPRKKWWTRNVRPARSTDSVNEPIAERLSRGCRMADEQAETQVNGHPHRADGYVRSARRCQTGVSAGVVFNNACVRQDAGDRSLPKLGANHLALNGEARFSLSRAITSAR